MYVIAGLGNPEVKYNGTRHNAGFGVIDVLAERLDIDVSKIRDRGLIGTGRTPAGERIVLVKPLTYMNNSGECIRPVSAYYKIDTTKELIVLSDDIALDVGRIRVRPGGSAGGHNGLKSIIAQLGHDSFSRVRIGVGKKPPRYDQVDWVLGHFPKEEVPAVQEAMERAADAVLCILSEGVETAMNRFNANNKEVS
ncbi:MAG: aminoacyl-tRNA hydrolase [Butyrivibrio sp.]|nr:aminoacyl-tRNA hydrolase [Butyrivibrio sp.]